MYRIKMLQSIEGSRIGKVTKQHVTPVYDLAKLEKVAKQWKILGFLAIDEIEITPDIQLVGGKEKEVKPLTHKEVIELFYPEKKIRENEDGFFAEDLEVKENLLKLHKNGNINKKGSVKEAALEAKEEVKEEAPKAEAKEEKPEAKKANQSKK